MGFDRQFSPAFNVDAPTYVTVDLPLLDLADTPDHRLWRKYQFPVTPAAVLLWQDGGTKLVDSLYDNDYLTCDDVVKGGWYTRSDSWQAQVLTAAGFTLIDYEGTVV